MCHSCAGGKLRFEYLNGLYRCPGYMDDEIFTNCGKKYSLEEVTRLPWIDDLL